MHESDMVALPEATNSQEGPNSKSMKPLILDLPREILLSIFKLCPKDSLKSLRLTHSFVKESATSILFRKWTLSITLYTAAHIRSPPPGAFFWRVSGGVSRHELRQSRPRAVSQAQTLQDEYNNGFNELKILYDNVQEIVIEHYDFYQGYPDEAAMDAGWPQYSSWSVDLLRKFLGRMKKLRSIIWDMPANNLDGAMDTPSLAATLTHLSLTSDPDEWYDRQMPVSPLTGFRALTNLTHLNLKILDVLHINAFNNLPNLTHLDLECEKKPLSIITFLDAQTAPFKLRSLTLKNDTRDIVFPDYLFAKFLSSLQSLHLVAPEAEIQRSRSDPAWEPTDPVDGDAKSIWTHLMENGIYISCLNAFGQSQSLLRYLLSYSPSSSTLKSLEIRVWPFMTKNPSHPRDFVHALWTQVVPLHRKTLTRLGIYPEFQSTTQGGNYTGHITNEDLNAMMSELTSPPTPETGLCQLNDEIKTVLKQCEKLEVLEMGSLSWKGASEFLLFVLFEMPRRLRDVGFYLNGWSRKPSDDDCIGSMGAHYAREFAIQRKPAMEATWNYEGEWNSREILDDWTWKRLRVNLLPLDSMWFVKGSDGKNWKLMDYELEGEICREQDKSRRSWTSVYDLLSGGGEIEYDMKAVYEAAVSNGRFTPSH